MALLDPDKRELIQYKTSSTVVIATRSGGHPVFLFKYSLISVDHVLNVLDHFFLFFGINGIFLEKSQMIVAMIIRMNAISGYTKPYSLD